MSGFKILMLVGLLGAEVAACSSQAPEGSETGGPTNPTSKPTGTKTCDGKPEGAYKCSGSTGILVCDDGAWVSAGRCDCSVKVGDWRKPPYATTCGIVIGTPNAVHCNFGTSAECKLCLPGEPCRTTCQKCATIYSTSGCCP